MLHDVEESCYLAHNVEEYINIIGLTIKAKEAPTSEFDVEVPLNHKLAACPNSTKHEGQEKQAGSPQERSSHRAERNPWRGRPLQAHSPGAGAQALPHLRRSPRLPSSSRVRQQRAGNTSAAPGTAATVQDGVTSRWLRRTSPDLRGSRRPFPRPQPTPWFPKCYSRV
ncbi:hypothetical protein NDU88_005525 [Pleurodeles waltl]|uniref:Uncharacterized protein n=1 Tax=Pleurodeles waltl TaxID=8319 RepID=A0AAV7PID6_PLEWA|nr:hypothetical protein NDU88_005525 [Pleurodeles waltl]